jgi:hypothetical protein
METAFPPGRGVLQAITTMAIAAVTAITPNEYRSPLSVLFIIRHCFRKAIDIVEKVGVAERIDQLSVGVPLASAVFALKNSEELVKRPIDFIAYRITVEVGFFFR